MTLWAVGEVGRIGMFAVSCDSDQIDRKITLDGTPKTEEQVCGQEIKVDSLVSWNIRFKTVQATELFMKDCDSLGFIDRRGAFYSVRTKPIMKEIKYLLENPLLPKSPGSHSPQKTVSLSFSQIGKIIATIERLPNKRPPREKK